MPRYRLKDKCLLVDAYVYDETNRKPFSANIPSAVPAPHVSDQNTDPATYVYLNDTAAFIARFIVMRVDTALIPDILKSEYGARITNPAQDVQDVLTILNPYLEPDAPPTFVRPYQKPKTVGKGKHPGKYPLDFSVNWFGTGGVLKGPL
jgi:hypothetical protein